MVENDSFGCSLLLLMHVLRLCLILTRLWFLTKDV